MDTKLKRWVRGIALFLIISVMTGSLIYGVFLTKSTNNEFDFFIDGEATSFEESEYYSQLISDQVNVWLVKQGICASSGDTKQIAYLDIYAKMKLVTKPYGKKQVTTIYQSDEATQALKNEKKSDFDSIVAGEQKYYVRLNANEKLNKDGSLQKKLVFSSEDDDTDASYPSDSYTVYNGHDFGLSLPERFFVNPAKNTRVQEATISVGMPMRTFVYYRNAYNKYVKAQEAMQQGAYKIVIIECLGILLLIGIFSWEKARPKWFERSKNVWYEFMMVLILGLFAVGTLICVYSSYAVQSLYSNKGVGSILGLTGIGIFVIIFLLMFCLEDLIWRIRTGCLIDSTLLLGSIHRWLQAREQRMQVEIESLEFEEQQMKKRNKTYRSIRWCVIGFMVYGCGIFLFDIVSSPIIAILGFLAIGAFVFYNLNQQYSLSMKESLDAAKMVNQIHKIADGDLKFDPKLSEDSSYYKASVELSNIGSGLEEALEKQMRDERMKIDLITNVSHDLKTPLTSMVGYIDLLNRDQTLSPESKDYVHILTQKTKRLQKLILDLFELAKATSGDVKVDFERINMRRLTEQVLGEMDDQIEQSNLSVVYKNHCDNPMFFADPNRMYRVLQNVIENALKYALRGTRIFIELYNEGNDVVFLIKNTASYEMNFTEEEIMERFARGDKARSSDGTGLGLSIADSFTKNCKGRLDVAIDGDQFKVIIRFLTLKEEPHMV